MINFKHFFLYSPGGEKESGNSDAVKKEEKNQSSENKPENKEEESKSIIKKIKDALQDWSTEDQAEQDFDDTRV